MISKLLFYKKIMKHHKETPREIPGGFFVVLYGPQRNQGKNEY
jgi:hypothetical protein